MKIAVFPNDPLRAYVAKGEIKTRYFNPGNLFDEVHVISLADDDSASPAVQEVAGRARLHVHPVGRVSLRRIAALPRVRSRILQVLREVRPDVIRAYNPLLAGALAVSCGKALGIPVVISVHGNYDMDVRRLYLLEGRMPHWLKYSIYGWTTETYALRGATKVIAAYEFPALYARSRGARDVTLIYNRVDLERFHPVPRAAGGDMQVLTVGRLDPEKNHACLIRALEGTTGIRLRIVGDGHEYGRLTALAAQLGVADRVTFVRQVPHRDIHTQYEQTDVFAIATRYGGVHIPVLEAMAAGLPIVIPQPRWEDAPEVAGESAEVVPNRPEAFRAAFERLRDDPAHRADLGRRARARIEPLGGAVMEARERQVYEQLIGRRPAPSHP